MKTARLQLFVSMGDRGQKVRPVLLEYEVNPPFKGRLYRIISAKDAFTMESYEVEGDSGIIAMNGCLDEMIAAADPLQVEMARKELGVDLTAPKKPVKKPIKPEPSFEEGLLNL